MTPNEQLDRDLAMTMEPKPVWIRQDSGQISIGGFWIYHELLTGMGNRRYSAPPTPRPHDDPAVFDAVVQVLLRRTGRADFALSGRSEGLSRDMYSCGDISKRATKYEAAARALLKLMGGKKCE